jgi:asparagine synthase (glutamine-hydrolysing)
VCGISAVIGAHADAAEWLVRMHAPIRHRGPDGEGFLHVARDGAAARDDDQHAFLQRGVPGAAIAFRWLKIQDTTDAARQPMASRDGRLWIALNGEIYNFRELARELAAFGHTFRSHSDTEVALAAYEQWGTDCFPRFLGMWAVVIVDTRSQTAVISRDRFGIKPLYYAWRDGSLLLASEARQFGCRAADLDSVARFTAGERPRPLRSFFAGVQAFPAASYAVIDLRAPRLEPRAYWSLANVNDRVITFEDAAERLDALLRSAMEMHLVAEVGVGTLLSGGLDSSLVTAIAARDGEPRRPAFSFVLNERIDRAFDESRYVDDVVQHTGVPTCRTTMTGDWLRENIARVTVAQEAPVTGAPVAAQFRTHQLAAASGVRVVLDGQGADETFAGYRRHHAVMLTELLLHGRLAAFSRELREAPPGSASTWLRQAVAAPLFRTVVPPRMPSWYVGAHEPLTRSTATNLGRTLHRDVTELNLPSVLAITDRNSMAHSLEARVPLLDHRIVEFAFTLPSQMKIGGGVRKRILRHVAQRYLPQSVLTRTDSIGFGTPQGRWMRGELRDAMRDAATSASIQQNAFIDGTRVRRLVDDFFAGRGGVSSHREVWVIYALHHWLTAFDITVS